jgi:hypothetical protein
MRDTGKLPLSGISSHPSTMHYKTVFLSNRLELPLQTVHIAIMAHFLGQVYTSFSPIVPLLQ